MLFKNVVFLQEICNLVHSNICALRQIMSVVGAIFLPRPSISCTSLGPPLHPQVNPKRGIQAFHEELQARISDRYINKVRAVYGSGK